MKLESVVKYHSPRSLSSHALSAGTSADNLSGTDVMAALGMALKKAPLGYSAFCSKMNLSQRDRKRTVELLTSVGLRVSSHYPALTKLSVREQRSVIRVIAIYAYLDYARSPETEIPCHACSWTGFRKGKRCSKCTGKGMTRAACKDCKGRGQSVNRTKTELQGVPVYQNCKRCGGRGFERIPSAVVFRALCQVTSGISLDTWNKSVKQLLDFLIAELHREEAWADKQICRITK